MGRQKRLFEKASHDLRMNPTLHRVFEPPYHPLGK